MVYVQKKDGTKDPWDSKKIVTAIRKSAERVMKQISNEDGNLITKSVISEISKMYDLCGEDVLVPVEQSHGAARETGLLAAVVVPHIALVAPELHLHGQLSSVL